MTTYDESWVKAEEAKRAWMHEHSLYKADDEHASCGVGLVVAIDGKPQPRHSFGAAKAGVAAEVADTESQPESALGRTDFADSFQTAGGLDQRDDRHTR